MMLPHIDDCLQMFSRVQRKMNICVILVFQKVYLADLANLNLCVGVGVIDMINPGNESAGLFRPYGARVGKYLLVIAFSDCNLQTANLLHVKPYRQALSE